MRRKRRAPAKSRFNGLLRPEKRLKPLVLHPARYTGLKPGANEIGHAQSWLLILAHWTFGRIKIAAPLLCASERFVS